MSEIWRDIKGYEGLYQISNFGNIKGLKYQKILTPKKRNDGYLNIQLYKNNKRKKFFIHRLVAETFLENPKKYPCVNHIDENKQNNNLINLEFCSIKYNNRYSLYKSNKRKRRKINQYDLNGNFIMQWKSIKEINRKLNLSYYGIFNCLSGRQNTSCNYIWKYEEVKGGV